jgi:hypothetical protein
MLKGIHSRIAAILKKDDFVDTEKGKILFDSIVNHLQALSENFKTIEKLLQVLLLKLLI